MKDCQAGCKYFSGGEVKHHKDCVHYPESFSKMYDDIYQQNKEKDAEIQRLTKEVETLNKSVDSWVEISTRDQNELTRLRELLERSHNLMSEISSKILSVNKYENTKGLVDRLNTDIDNALNPKP